MTKAKNAAKAVGSAGKKGIVGMFKGVVAAGTSKLAFSIAMANVFMFALYNSFAGGTNAWTIPAQLYNAAYPVAGELVLKDPLVGGLFVALVAVLVGIGYMTWVTYDVLGRLGITVLCIVLGSLGLWAWTGGLFDGIAVALIVTLVQTGVAFILGFGFVAARLHRQATGQGNMAGDIALEE